MLPAEKSPIRMAFGPFEVDAGAEELLKSGTRIRLPGQPFQILLILLAQPGEVVSREQLRERIWTDGTFVDFEHGLNAAINRLRRALGDAADNPRYVETVTGRGYRFIGRLEQRASAAKIHVIAAPMEEPKVVNVARRGRNFYGWLGLAGLALAAVASGVFVLRSRPAADPLPAVQFSIASPAGSIFSAPIARQSFAISPDGTRLAFVATGSAHPGIWVRELALTEPHPVEGTESAWSVFWSPDSRSIYYSAKRELRQANLETKTNRTVATLPVMAMYGSWRSPEDLLIYVGPTSFYELSMKTGSLRDLSGESMRWSQFLPRSDEYIHVVFDPALAHYRAVATNFKTRQSTPLMETESRVEYAPPIRAGEPGHLLFLRGGSLVAQAFDASHLELSGDAFPIVQNVTHFSPSATGCFSVSKNGVLVYQVGAPASELRWYDRAGRVVSTAAHSGPFNGSVRISPDGRSVAAGLWNVATGTADVWVFDRKGRESRRLTYPPAMHSRPMWSPDGRRIAYSASLTGSPSLTSISTDESGKEEPMGEGPVPGVPWGQIQNPTDWSRDGRFIVYDDSSGEEERQVWLLDVATRKLMPLLQSGSGQWGAAFSPDGKEVAFISDESGQPEVYLQRFEALPTPHVTGPRRQISRGSAWLVRWRPDGREIFFVGLDSRLYAAQVVGGGFAEPKALFAIPGNPQSGTASDFQFDVSSDGQQFAMTTVGSAAPPDFVVVQNWQSMFHR